MKVLVINSGSSSLKYQLFDMKTEQVLAKGLVERIGIADGKLKHTSIRGNKLELQQNFENHNIALEQVFALLIDEEQGVLSDLSEIEAIGHRVVHGGENFHQSMLINDDLKAAIEELSALAPLHNPANLMGIEACEKILPGIPNVAVFDTAFHQSMPKKTYLYALPYERYENYKVRRYGFHGTSHRYVYERLSEILGRNNLKVITCHVGNGASITAIDSGRVINTSMGFTPLEGLIMGTRSGDIDPAIIPYMMKKENLSPNEIETILNKKSGILGLYKHSSDHREIEEGYLSGKELETDIIGMITDNILKYIGAYAAMLQGVDAIVFTAGILENSKVQRELIGTKLAWMGLEFDEMVNDFRGEERKISTAASKVQLRVIPTDEELMIAKDTYMLTKK